MTRVIVTARSYSVRSYLNQECIPVGCLPLAVVDVCLGVVSAQGGLPGVCLSRGSVCQGAVSVKGLSAGGGGSDQGW